MSSIIHLRIPPFSISTYHNGIFKTLTEKDVLGKWSIFFFYPSDFSPICEVELAGLAEKQEEFNRMNVRIFAITTDSHFVHKAWCDRSKKIQTVRFPMLSDRPGNFCRALGAMSDDGTVLIPTTLVANPEGEIKIAEMYDISVVRKANELLRKVKAAIFIAEHPGEACPANWQEGDQTIKPSIDLIGTF